MPKTYSVFLLRLCFGAGILPFFLSCSEVVSGQCRGLPLSPSGRRACRHCSAARRSSPSIPLLEEDLDDIKVASIRKQPGALPCNPPLALLLTLLKENLDDVRWLPAEAAGGQCRTLRPWQTILARPLKAPADNIRG